MMELHELQKMISIIHDKKPRCRGNLRVKVLLKSTHDFVRQSLIDDQLGNSESLMTLLRNSGTAREPTSSANTSNETDLLSVNREYSSFVVNTDSNAMDCDPPISPHTLPLINDLEMESSSSSNQIINHHSESSTATSEAFFEDNFNKDINYPTKAITDSLECGEAFKNSNKNIDRSNDNNKLDKYFKLTRAIRKVMKHWDQLMLNAKNDTSCLKRHSHSVKKMRKLLLESKLCFKADFENQSSPHQQIIQLYLKVIKKMLKQCDNILDYK